MLKKKLFVSTQTPEGLSVFDTLDHGANSFALTLLFNLINVFAISLESLESKSVFSLCLHIRVYLYIFPLWRRCFPSGFHQSLRPLASAYRDLAGGFLDVFGLVACFCQCFDDV